MISLLALGNLLAMLIVIGTAVVWALDTRLPLEVIYAAPTPVRAAAPARAALVTQPTVRPGETFLIWREWCVLDPVGHARGEHHRTLVCEGFQHSYANTVPGLVPTPGCYQRAIAYELPSTAPPGRCQLQVVTQYWKNPLRTLLVRWPDVVIEVAGSPSRTP